MNIFIHKDGQQHGPCSLDEVNSKALTGEFTSSDPAWIEGWADWQPLSCLSGFVSRPAVPPPFRPQVSSPPIAASTPTAPPVRLGPIIRDIVIVWVLTAIGGFVAGVATGGPERDAPRFMLALMVSGLLLGTVAFTIAGCLAPPARWRHLGFVALGAWLTGLINVAFFGVSIPQWIEGAIFMGIIMGAGGAISYVFNRGPKPFKPQVSPTATIPPSPPQLSQVDQTSKEGSAPRAAWYGSAATVGTYVAGLLLLVTGFLSQDGAYTYDIPRGISAQAAGITGGACPALLLLAGFFGWYRWCRGHRGSVIMLVGLVAAAKGLGALIARLMIIFYVSQAAPTPGAVPAIVVEPRPASPQPSPTTETEADQEFERTRAKSKAEAIALYPDAANVKTPLGKEVARLIKSYQAANDPVLYSPDAPMLITVTAARNLGIPPPQAKR